MWSDEVKKKLEAGEYYIEGISSCKCNVDFEIDDDGYLIETADRGECGTRVTLTVDSETILEYFPDTDRFIRPKNVYAVTPCSIMDEMVAEGELLSNTEHYFTRVDKLAKFIIERGLFPERYDNFFLLVEYEEFIPISMSEAEQWASGYLESDHPNFVYVDNTLFLEDVFLRMKKNTLHGENYDESKDAIKKVTLRDAINSDIEERFDRIYDEFEKLLNSLHMARLDVSKRAVVIELFDKLEKQFHENDGLLWGDDN